MGKWKNEKMERAGSFSWTIGAIQSWFVSLTGKNVPFLERFFMCPTLLFSLVSLCYRHCISVLITHYRKTASRPCDQDCSVAIVLTKGATREVDCKAVPFFSPNQRTTRVRGRRDARPRGTSLPFLQSRAAAHLTPVPSRAPASFAGWERKKGLLYSLGKCEKIAHVVLMLKESHTMTVEQQVA